MDTRHTESQLCLMCHFSSSAPIEPPEAKLSHVHIPGAQGRMLGILSSPSDSERGRVIIIHDVFGIMPFYEQLAARLADVGFTTLLPDLFFREGGLLEQSLDAAYSRLMRANNQLLLYENAQAAIDWLRNRDVLIDRVATMGFCWGGTQVLVMAAERSDVATVCYYGMPADPRYLSDAHSTRPLDLVSSISGPVIGFWGDQDSRVGIHNVQQFMEAAQQGGIEVEGHIYPGVGHGFMSQACEPGEPTFEAITQSWDRTIGFLESRL